MHRFVLATCILRPARGGGGTTRGRQLVEIRGRRPGAGDIVNSLYEKEELKLGVTLAGNSLPVVPSWRIKSHSARSECTVGHRRLCSAPSA